MFPHVFKDIQLRVRQTFLHQFASYQMMQAYNFVDTCMQYSTNIAHMLPTQSTLRLPFKVTQVSATSGPPTGVHKHAQGDLSPVRSTWLHPRILVIFSPEPFEFDDPTAVTGRKSDWIHSESALGRPTSLTNTFASRISWSI